jgi:hypothetical protein
VSRGAVESRKVSTLPRALSTHTSRASQVPVEKLRRSPYGTHIYPREGRSWERERAPVGLSPLVPAAAASLPRNKL